MPASEQTTPVAVKKTGTVPPRLKNYLDDLFSKCASCISSKAFLAVLECVKCYKIQFKSTPWCGKIYLNTIWTVLPSYAWFTCISITDVTKFQTCWLRQYQCYHYLWMHNTRKLSLSWLFVKILWRKSLYSGMYSYRILITIKWGEIRHWCGEFGH